MILHNMDVEKARLIQNNLRVCLVELAEADCGLWAGKCPISELKYLHHAHTTF